MSADEKHNEAPAAAVNAPQASADENAAPNPNQAPEDEKVKGRCDVCQKADRFQGHRLRKCTSCGVCVHNLCIGKVTRKGVKDTGWKCVACSAVGKRFVVSKPGKNVKTLLQEERPQECALCSVRTGTHHMHPLFGTHGRKGTHLVLKPDKKQNLPSRLAWVHTLCAMFVSKSTGGTVFACDRNGDYGGDSDGSDDNDDGDDSDDGSISSSSESSRGGGDDAARKEERPGDSNHGPRKEEGEEETPKEKPVANGGNVDAGKDLVDEDNSEDELELMETHHFVIANKERGQDTPWTKLIEEHRNLKCTFCGLKDVHSTRIPVQCCAGSDNEYKDFKKRHEPDVYCTQAMHVGCARWGPDDVDRAPVHRRVYFYPGQEEGTTAAESEHGDPVADCYCDLHAKDIFKNNPKRVEERKQQREMSRRERMLKREAHRGEEGRDGGTAATRPIPAPARPAKRQRSNEEYDRLDDTALKRLVRGKVRFDYFPDIKEDVLRNVLSAKERGKDVMEATTKCKKYWMQQTEMPKNEFKKLWARVKMAVQDVFTVKEGMEKSSSSKAVKPKPKLKPAKHLSSQGAERKGPNPWARLWMDDFCEGGEYRFNKWDECVEEEDHAVG